MARANKHCLNTCAVTCLIALVLLLRIASNQDTSSFNELSSDGFSQDCDLKHWLEVDGIYDADFAKALSVSCRQLLMSNTSLLFQPKPLLRMNIIQHIGKQQPLLWQSYIHKVMDATRVKIVVASYDRPAALYNTLSIIDSLVSGASVFVSYDAPTPDGMKAYASVLSEFPTVQSRIRSEQEDYFEALKAVSEQDASHILIAADDTTFIRPINLARVAAFMMLLGDGERQRYRVSTQLRISYPYPYDQGVRNVVGKLLLPDELYLFMTDCSDISPDLSVCYDRQMDGGFYSVHQLKEEWPFLVRHPSHPAELEELWMWYRANHRTNKADFSLFLADQVVINSGMGWGTVRDERKVLETESFIAEQQRLRADEAHLLLNGCRQKPLDYMQTYLSYSAIVSILMSGPSMEWHCPS